MTARNVKTLYVDIETTPIVVHAWSLRDLNVGLSQIVEHPRIMGFAAAWEGKPVKWYAEWDEGGRQGMLQTAHELLSEADCVVHYNGKRFDTPWFFGEFAKEGMLPPAPFKEIDLYRVAKKNFRLASHKLQYVSTHLGLEGKVDTGGHGLWVACMKGDPKARARMAKYAKQDVALLPRLLDRLRPWLGNEFNRAIGADVPTCPKCGSDRMQSRGQAVATTGNYQRYQCQGCGGWSRSTRRVETATTTGVS